MQGNISESTRFLGVLFQPRSRCGVSARTACEFLVAGAADSGNKKQWIDYLPSRSFIDRGFHGISVFATFEDKGGYQFLCRILYPHQFSNACASAKRTDSAFAVPAESVCLWFGGRRAVWYRFTALSPKSTSLYSHILTALNLHFCC